MALPQQLLDGLVDFNDGVTSPEVETTCELLESAINLYENTEQRCLDLPFDQLRQFCSCSTDGEVIQDNVTCNLCVGGETIVQLSNSSFMYDANLISCLDAAHLANSTEKGSDVCNAMQNAGTICGCPISTNACQLCGQGGVLDESNKENVFESGQVTHCILLEAKLHLVEQSSPECLMNKELYASACGCKAEVEFQPCTLCTLGEPVPYPERIIPGLDDLDVSAFAGMQGFDITWWSQSEKKCGTIERSIALLDRNSSVCIFTQAFSKLCGCAPKTNACSLCGDGNSMTKPFAEAEWTSGKKLQEILSGVVSAESASAVDYHRMYSCEIVDSAITSWAEASDGMCFYEHLIRSDFCGCDGTSTRGVKAIIYLQRCSGALSLIGSLCIVLFIVFSPPKTRWSTFHQLMFSISFFDSLTAIGFILGTLPAPENTGIYEAIGNEATCTFQGWIFQIGQISVYYNVALSMYFLLVIKHSWSDRRFQQIGKYVHTVLVGAGLVSAFASIPFQEPNYRWCNVAWPPIGASYAPGLIFFLAPVGLCILVITILTIQLVHFVNVVENKSKAKSMGNKSRGSRMASRTFWQSLWFLVAFYLVWPVMFSTFVMLPKPRNFWFFLVGSALGPSQGFFNACIFFNRQKDKIKKKILNMLGIQYKPNGRKSSVTRSGVAGVSGIGTERPVTGSDDKGTAARQSGLHYDSNDDEDYKEEERVSTIHWGAMEHTMHNEDNHER